MAQPIEITDENFKSEILESETPALLDFSAAWCPPCRILDPILEQLVDEYDGRVKIGSVNVDNGRQTAGQFGIMGIPTLIFFQNGEEVDRIAGLSPKSVIKTKLDALL